MVCDVFSHGPPCRRHYYGSPPSTSASVYDISRLPTQRIQTKYGLAKLQRQGLGERFLPGIVQYLDLGIAHVTFVKSGFNLSPAYRLYRSFGFFFHPCIYVHESLLYDVVASKI
jgi:hypothetical protein